MDDGSIAKAKLKVKRELDEARQNGQNGENDDESVSEPPPLQASAISHTVILPDDNYTPEDRRRRRNLAIAKSNEKKKKNDNKIDNNNDDVAASKRSVLRLLFSRSTSGNSCNDEELPPDDEAGDRFTLSTTPNPMSPSRRTMSTQDSARSTNNQWPNHITTDLESNSRNSVAFGPRIIETTESNVELGEGVNLSLSENSGLPQSTPVPTTFSYADSNASRPSMVRGFSDWSSETIIATPVPFDDTYDRQKKSPFRDRRVLSALLIALMIIIVLTVSLVFDWGGFVSKEGGDSGDSGDSRNDDEMIATMPQRPSSIFFPSATSPTSSPSLPTSPNIQSPFAPSAHPSEKQLSSPSNSPITLQPTPQAGILTTAFDGSMQRNGCMFDVFRKTSDIVVITGMILNINSTKTMHVDIFTKRATYRDTSEDWVHTSNTKFRGRGYGHQTILATPFFDPIALSTVSKVTAFYISLSDKEENLVYGAGTFVGNIAAEDENLAILEGASVQNAFQASVQLPFQQGVTEPRLWNGGFIYEVISK